jgi:predicted amidohydrolase YtcJ
MSKPPHPHADILITGARILTMDPVRPSARAIAITGNTIAAIGSAAEIAAWQGPDTRVIDGGGRTLTPGICGKPPAHLHGQR